MVDFDCKMGHGSNQDQLRKVVMIVDGDHNVVVDVGNVDDILVYDNGDHDYNGKYEIVKI